MANRKLVFVKNGRPVSRRRQEKRGNLSRAYRQFDHLCKEAAKASTLDPAVLPEKADQVVAACLTETRKGLPQAPRLVAVAQVASAVRQTKNAKANLALARGIEAQAEAEARQAKAEAFGDRRTSGVVVRKTAKQPLLVAAARAAEAALATARQGVASAQAALVGVINPGRSSWANPLAA